MAGIYLITLILGMITGLFMEKLAVSLIDQRVSKPDKYIFSGSWFKTALWAVVNCAGWFLIVLIGGLNVKSIESILIFSVCIIISAVDISIKKIPNEMLAFILVVGIIFIFINNQGSSIGINIIGLVIGFVIFFLPAAAGKGAGWGDVKFAAVAGFCLGLYNLLLAIIVMTLILLIYAVHLIITGKGGLKSKIALGPFLAAGFIIVLVSNINTGWTFLNLGRLLNL